jgi:hypothetical protein
MLERSNALRVISSSANKPLISRREAVQCQVCSRKLKTGNEAQERRRDSSRVNPTAPDAAISYAIASARAWGIVS